MSRIWNARRDDDSGFTLVETLVTMILMSVVGALLLAAVSSMTEATTRETLNIDAQRSLDQLMRQMSQDIRAADQISATYPGSPVCPTGGTNNYNSPNYSGYRNCLSFRIPRPTTGAQICPYTMVTYGLTSGVLRETRVEYRISGATCVAGTTTASKVLLRKVPTGTSLFRYFNSTGIDMLDGISPPVAPTSAAAVQVNLSTRYRNTGNAVARLSTSIALRNQR